MVTRKELLKAKSTLGLPERATRKEIKSTYRSLMHKWHPDKNRADLKKAQEISATIIDAYKIVTQYCNSYEYDFSEEYLEKFESPQEWWSRRFGNK